MAYEQESRKLFFTAVGLIICVAGLFAVIGIADRADALPAGSCSSTCVTTLNGLSNIINIVPFSSLNLTVTGQNINIGLALNHQNYFSAQQTFNANVNFGSTSTIDYLSTCYLQFSTFPTISPCVDNSLQLGGLSHRIYSVVSEDFFVPAIKGDIYGASELSYNGVGGYLSLGALTNSTAQDVMLERSAAKTLSFYTFDNSGSFVQRLQINGNAAQGSAGITSYESLSSQTTYSIFHSLSDANPTSQLGDGFLKFGAGGSNALRTQLSWDDSVGALLLQTTGSNQPTVMFLAPQGTSPYLTGFLLSAVSDITTNTENMQLGYYSNAGGYVISANKGGSGSLHNILFDMGGSEAFRITTTPTVQMSVNLVPYADNSLDVGTPALRFALVRAVTITSGDFNFWPNPCGVPNATKSCNQSPLYTLTEDLTGKGLIFENHVTNTNSTVALLNADGSASPQLTNAIQKVISQNPAQTVTQTTTVLQQNTITETETDTITTTITTSFTVSTYTLPNPP